MASISSSSSLSFLSSVNASSSPSSFSPSFSQRRTSRNTKPKRYHVSKISCKAMHNEPENPKNISQENQQLSHVLANRRNVVLGLGGLYGVAAANPFAFAAPVSPPDLTTCGPPDLPSGVKPTNCCPPVSTKIIDFKLPSSNQPLRVRPAAHLVTADHLAKYKKATELMKALPSDDPRNFTQQANVHCAYCDGAYHQVGFPDLDLQVHNSWLFFPFHRWYLYFYERILGSLIGDPSFSLPFWNWDSPGGMQLPAIYTDSDSSLYDVLRSAKHQPPAITDLDFNLEDANSTSQNTGNDRSFVTSNLTIMYRQMVSNAKTPRLFFGNAYRAGDEPDPGAGSIENIPHGPVHLWTGDNKQPNIEDMGTFYSAARDPIFFCHHSNVDRMWSLWKTLGGKRREITDPDWLNSGFLFYDENKNLVHVKVKDCLDTRNLGYVYQDVDIPWLKSKPTPRRRPSSKTQKVSLVPQLFGVGAAQAAETSSKSAKFPLVLDSTVSTFVKRPKKGRSKKEKEDQEEVLVIEGIEFERNDAVKFDVFVNDEDDKVIRPDDTEFAGSFVSVPHTHKHKNKKIITCLRLGLTDLLEDLEAEDDDSVRVTLVPRYGKGSVTIRGIKIELLAD
ncbi:polyphenol oxidase, chloroplastic-like [Prosopis cineraria]|uniref:polyphenol oxidase, chloroplastic-like n=1 Tax=Prosopis cineraria TaxID=364024 RepID=UPI00241032EA|nr:polyphenol oxidase, chloroplastic-like [Prosopis cineraria]